MQIVNTLRFRFALWTAGLLMLALLIFGIFVYLGLAKALYQSVDDELRLTAEATMDVVLQDGQISADEALEQVAVPARPNNHGIVIRLLASDGTVLQVTGPALFTPTLSLRSATAQPYFETQFDSALNLSVRHYTLPIIQNNQALGIVQVSQSLNGIEDTLRRLLLMLLLGIPVLVIAAAAGGYFLAVRALARVDHITQTARAISAADLSARLNLPATHDEVGRLALTFDDMLTRLEASFERERRFLADASHELRTPLTAMQAILGVMREQRRTPEDYENALSDLAEVSNRMRSLVENLLQVARAESPATLVKTRVNVTELLQDLCEVMQPTAQQRGLMLMADIENSLFMLGDGDALLRVFLNLIDNGLKYTEVGSVRVAAMTIPRNVIQVCITDTGCGIAPQHLAHIFDRFYRAEPSRTEAGFGLGLTIVHDIVRQHGGAIEVNSIVGKGSIFIVTLPKSS